MGVRAEYPETFAGYLGATVWRYLDFTKFVHLLESRTLCFSLADHGTNNGYATNRLAVALQNMAAYFADVLTEDEEDPVEVPAINITATSLPWGGLFDLESEWSPPHRGHRFGNEADLGVSGLTDAQKRAMATTIMRAHIGTPVTAESPFASAAGSCDVTTDCPKGYYCAGGQCAVNHWHLRVPYEVASDGV